MKSISYRIKHKNKNEIALVRLSDKYFSICDNYWE